MPRVSTSGFTNVLRDVNDTDFTWSAGDTGAKILSLTAPRTFHLPGPSTNADALPSDGDYYDFLDPIGIVSALHSVTISGGGYPILGAATLVLTSANLYIRFIFCSTPGIGAGGAWQAAEG